MPSNCRHITDNTLQPTNTYQLRGRDVLPRCGQPPLNQKKDREYTEVDKSQPESTSEESTNYSSHSIPAGGSRRQSFQSQNLQQGEEQNVSNLHATIQQQSNINTVRPILGAQHGAFSDEQESGLPMLRMTATPAIIETCISDRTVNVSRGVPDGLLSISSRTQNEEGSQEMCIPARMPPHIPAPTQDLNATLAQFRTNFQQVFDLVQAPLVKDRVRATDLEQELSRRQNDTMRLGSYAACMMIDIKDITEAIASIEAHSTVIETLVVETSKAAQKRAKEKVGLHIRVNDLENNLVALQEILSGIASPSY